MEYGGVVGRVKECEVFSITPGYTANVYNLRVILSVNHEDCLMFVWCSYVQFCQVYSSQIHSSNEMNWSKNSRTHFNLTIAWYLLLLEIV